MNKSTVLSRSIRQLLPVAALFAATSWASAVTWDANTGVNEAQDGAGTWTEGGTNWWDGVMNFPWANADLNYVEFGIGTAGTTNVASRDITVTGTVNVRGIDFLSIGNPVGTTNPAYLFKGDGKIVLEDGGIITAYDGSNISAGLITFNVAIGGADINLERNGINQQFFAFGGANTWTGKLTLGTGLFVRLSGGATVSTLDTVEVGAGSTVSLLTPTGGGAQTYESDFKIGGRGSDLSRGALRIDDGTTAAPTTLNGQIILADNDAVVATQNSSGTGSVAIVKGGITDSGGAWNFTKTGTGTLIVQGASNYRGETILGPNGTTANAGTLQLDFANANVTSDLLYNGVSANKLNLTGVTSVIAAAGTGSTATLLVTGKAGTTNSQTFSGLNVTGFTAVTVNNALVDTTPSGTVNLDLGTITRTGVGSYLAITGPANGSITAANSAGLLGPWATYNGLGWAGVSGGMIGLFTGDLNYTSGNVSSLPGYSAGSNLRISSTSAGNVSLAAGTTGLNSITLTDTGAAHTVAIGAGQTLRFGQAGGVQMLADTQGLTVGTAPGVGTIIAGTATGAELFFSNYSTVGNLVVNAGIADNGAGGYQVTVNGGGRTVFAGAGTYSGTTVVQSGALEVQHSTGLGSTAGATIVAPTASVLFSGQLDVGEAFTIAGTGLNGAGALRNLSGTTVSSGLISLEAASRINSDAGRLLLNAANSTTNIITGANTITLGGSGVIEVNGRIGTTAGGISKDGTGLVILSGANTYVGTTAVGGTASTLAQSGVLRITNGNALGTATGVAATGTTVYTGAALELAGGITVGNETLALSAGSGTAASANSGWLRNLYGDNTWGGQVTFNASSRVHADIGSTLTFDVASGDALVSTGSSRTMAFGGNGTIIVKDSIGQIGTGITTFVKDGGGTLVLQGAANLATGSTMTINGGTLVLDYANAASIIASTQTLTFGGSTLKVLGGAGNSAPVIGPISITASTGLSQIAVGANTNLTITGTWTRGSDAFMLLDLSASGSAITGTPGVVGGAGLNKNMITGGTGGASAYFAVKDSAGYDFAALNGTTVGRLGGTTPLVATGGSGTTPYLLTGSTTPFELTGAVGVSTIRVDTTAAASTLDLKGQTLTMNKIGLLIDGSNDFTLTDTSATQAGKVTNTNAAIFFYHFGTGKFTLDAAISNGASGRIFFIGDQGNLVDWTAPTAAGGTTYIQGTTVRISDPLAMDLTNNSTANALGAGYISMATGGVLELATGDLTRDLGTSGSGKLGFQGGDSGGFSAYGADRKVSLNPSAATQTLTWGSTSGFLANGRALILGSAHANAVVDLTNNLDLNGGNQTVEVLSESLAGRGGKISGSISGATGSLTKSGRGNLELSGNNTYGGSTQVAEGTLNISGALDGTNGVFVSTDATLQISGTGVIKAGTLSLNNNSTLSLEIGGLTTAPITLTGAVSLFGHIDLVLALTADPIDSLTYTLIDGAAALAGYAAGGRFYYGGLVLDEGTIFTVNYGGFTQDFEISYSADGGRDVTLLAVVPEPSTPAVLCASLGMLIGLNRFRRRTGLLSTRG